MLGVGIMGRAMAANLVKAGFVVSGYDPDPKAMKRLKAAGGRPCARSSAARFSTPVIRMWIAIAPFSTGAVRVMRGSPAASWR
jgi:3-hydroxyisobutyrate dehydrogenase-like beta-hydroxyacid dehydrogenase